MPLSLLDATGLRDALAGSPWREVDVYDSVGSTNLEALRRPLAWRVVAAGHQSAGRGRMTRSWESPEGTSVAVSALVPLPADRPQDWGWLPLLTGLAAWSAVLEAAGGSVEVGLKWPNDVLVRPRVDRGAGSSGDGSGGAALGDPGAPQWGKVAGILCETAPTGGEPVAVVGTGINVAQRAADLPVPTATSLLAGGVDVGKDHAQRVGLATALVAAYLLALAARVDSLTRGGAALEAERAAYRRVCTSLGRWVTVHRTTGSDVTGWATGVDEQGRLLVRGEDGCESAYAAGDVEHLRR